MGGVANAYNGLGQRVAQTVNSITTEYLLDVQPGLWKVLASTETGQTTRYVHGPRGIQAQQNHDDTWRWVVQDGLGSVRGVVNSALTRQESRLYAPYGDPYGETGSEQTMFGFTGEQVDVNELVYLRARQYSPELGVFASLDPVEGVIQRAMSLNGYSWVEGNVAIDAVGELGLMNGYNYANANPVNRVDPSGMCWENSSASPEQQSQCFEAWSQYLDIIGEQYPNHWPLDLVDLVYQEGNHWESLSYTEFVSQWNSSRPPSQTDPGVGLQQGAALAVTAGASTGPTPDDLLWLFGALCLYGASLLAQTGAISLPLRQPFDFSIDNSQDDAIPIPIPIPYDRTREDNDETWYHYTDEVGIADIAATGVIRANSANIVYVTRYLYAKDEVLYALFAGNPAYEGKGEYYAEFVAQDGVVFLGAGAAPEATQANEWIHYGSLRPIRDIKYYVYVGPNPF